ncbi:MAG: toll/interleukin-1 receptor domain-containing protein, partial [Rhodospirillales bacterium]
MRVFVSFASEQKETAEPIVLALRDRGHQVFFSHDDLPRGDSFDLRIQKAIQSIDLMVFLISPEAVTRGRYTLTELSFTRERWPNPKGRVLPVTIAPTPMEAIPNYLKAVSILEPLGNAAAETCAAADKLLKGA